MNSEHVIPDTILQILDSARWCPSPDNLQSWKFKIISETSFEIHCRDESDWMVYDLNGHVSWLTIGLLFETIDISAKQHGFNTRYEKRPNGDDQQLTIFLVTLTADEITSQHPLFNAIKTRSVQRKLMGSKPLSEREKLAFEQCLPTGFELTWFESSSEKKKIGKLLYGNSHTRYVMKEGYDVHSKIIDFRKGYETFSPTKIPPKSLGVDPITQALTKWAMKSWSRFHFVEKYLFGTVWAKFRLDYLTAIKCSGHFLLTKTETDKSLDDFIETGRVVMRLWLTAETLGLGCQPEYTPIMFAEFQREGINFSTDARALQNASTMDEQFKGLVGEEKVRTCAFLARIGRSSAPTSRSVRKELSDLLIG
ncbi:hypothetical protein J7384_15850 [Endozoicomonas sp. G2_1]|uniref:hypothetical protein n=1 Tax=Endozoicomonas sp. G2_1 TaxID=2821091 RepID=UPI001ADAD43F|nr:hypothetical protein [Endozoicomonas sp. G2_1]MBO9491833.1 hypothetical protein [Endozoicomonas sp. G2_1]